MAKSHTRVMAVSIQSKPCPLGVDYESILNAPGHRLLRQPPVSMAIA
jgi:hypothetical protein